MDGGGRHNGSVNPRCWNYRSVGRVVVRIMFAGDSNIRFYVADPKARSVDGNGCVAVIVKFGERVVQNSFAFGGGMVVELLAFGRRLLWNMQ